MDQKALNKDPMKIFIPIVKVDEEKRLVYGRVTEEKADSSNETFDYATSKPYYEEWSGYFYKATDGKSYGNLRAMHDQKKASGTIQNLNLDDQDKSVEVVAKVVDDEDWKKCLEGVYTGFSQGGRYVKKWFDGKTNRYTAQPNEISLVDYPALKSATFSLVKANGIVEEHEFKKIAEREEVNPERGKKEYGDVKFADEKNKKYPIDTEAHIRAAWNYINKPKNAWKYSSEDVKTIKNKIIAAWKKKIDKEGPPSAKDESEKIDAMTDDELKKAEIDLVFPEGDLKKWAGEPISDSITATYCLQTIFDLYGKEMTEEEGDAGQVASLKAVIDNLKSFIASEIQEDYEEGLMALSQKAADLQKSGARHSRGDVDIMQKIHNHTEEMGAECKCQKCNETKKVDADNELSKSMTKAMLSKIQAIHDHTNELGIECRCEKCNQTQKGEEAEDMEKIEQLMKRQDALEAENKKINEENESLKKRVEELEKKPAEAKGAKMDVSAISKQEDTANRLDKQEEEIKDPMTMLNKVHSDPRVFSLRPMR